MSIAYCRTWSKWRYRNAGRGRVPVSSFSVSIAYCRTWRKVRERNAGGACGNEREAAFALQAAQYQQGIRPAWLQATTLATTVKWHDPTPVVGYVDEGLLEWRP